MRGTDFKRTTYFVILSAVYLLDVITKWAVRHWMPLYSEIKILPFFSLSHVTNTGVAFGFFQEQNRFFLVVGVIAALLIIYVGTRMLIADRFSALVLAGVAGGAMGNLTDRYFRGHVTDFLDFYIGRHHWPAFNVADSAICVGAILLLLRSFKKGHVSNSL